MAFYLDSEPGKAPDQRQLHLFTHEAAYIFICYSIDSDFLLATVENKDDIFLSSFLSTSDKA